MICPQKDETDPIPKTVNACIENNIVFHEINQVPKLLSLWWRLVPVGASSLRARLWKTLTEGFLSGWSFIHIALMVPYLQQHRTHGDTDARHAEQHHAHAQPKKKKKNTLQHTHTARSTPAYGIMPRLEAMSPL